MSFSCNSSSKCRNICTFIVNAAVSFGISSGFVVAAFAAGVVAVVVVVIVVIVIFYRT
jgi:hypothetical protein